MTNAKKANKTYPLQTLTTCTKSKNHSDGLEYLHALEQVWEGMDQLPRVLQSLGWRLSSASSLGPNVK